MTRVTTHEAKTQLSRLLARVRDGEEIVICRGDRPVARLAGLSPREPNRRTRPRVGTITTEGVRWTEDAFAPLGQRELEDWGL